MGRGAVGKQLVRSMSTIPASRPVNSQSAHGRWGVLLGMILLAAAHAVWAAQWLVEQFHQSPYIYGGFRLLGSPNSSWTAKLLHLDFLVLLIGVIWLVHQRWTFQRPAVIEQESVAWTAGHRWGLAGVMALGGGLLFWNLGGPLLWQDEAQSALISRTVLETGIPRGTDGHNYFSQEFEAEYAQNYVWRWHTWLPFYMVAGSYQLLGDSTFAARFPAALLGWITIWLTYQTAIEIWKDRRSALSAAGVLAVCVGFLLLSRQCRYYSALMCFTLLSTIGYWRLMRSERRGYLLLISGMTLLFHTHYIYTGICGAAFITHCALHRRERWKSLMIAAATVVVLALPWVLWFLSMKYGARYGGRMFDLGQSWEDLGHFLTQTADDLVPVLLLPIPLLIGYLKKKFEIRTGEQPQTEAMSLVVILIATHMILLTPIVPIAFFRYLAPIVPLTALVMGKWIADASRVHRALAAWMMAVVVLSWPCADYVTEQLCPVNAPGVAILKYFQTHSTPHEVIVASYGDLPLKYYLPNRILGGRTGEDLSHIEPPEWLITRRYRKFNVDQKLDQWIATECYDPIVIPVPDTPCENREEPRAHLFATDRSQGPVVIYRRKNNWKDCAALE